MSNLSATMKKVQESLLNLYIYFYMDRDGSKVYDSFGRLIEVHTDRTDSKYIEYDTKGRVIRISYKSTSPEYLETVINFCYKGSKIFVSENPGSEEFTPVLYDKFGNILQVLDVVQIFDEKGRRVSYSSSLFDTTYEYDEFDRLICSTGFDRTVEYVPLNCGGTLVRSLVEGSLVDETYVDNFGREIYEKNIKYSNFLIYAYEGKSSKLLTRIDTQRSKLCTYSYNEAGQLTKVTCTDLK